jgi:hypothetical protein
MIAQIVCGATFLMFGSVAGFVAGRLWEQRHGGEPDPPEQMRHMRRWQAEQGRRYVTEEDVR